MSDRIDEAIEKLNKIESVCARLYGDSDYPGMEGDIPQMKRHMEKINGRMDLVEDNLTKNNTKWKILAGVGGTGGLAGVGAFIKTWLGL